MPPKVKKVISDIFAYAALIFLFSFIILKFKYEKDDLKAAILNNQLFISNEEIKFKNTLLPELTEYANSNNFKQLYKNLIANLDQESINIVNRILYRGQKDANYLLDLKELEQYEKIKRNFKILKLNEYCYAWRNYFLPIDHFESNVFFDQGGITNFSRHDLGKIRKKDIIDAGGFIGDSAIVYSPYTDKKVYSFEPGSRHFQLMQTTIKMNEIENIVPVNCGLGEKEDEARIPVGIGSDYQTDQDKTEKYSPEETEKVKITTLDQYVEENNLHVGLIKTDVEGAEQSLLKGAEKTIRTQKPCLLISIYHNGSDFFNIKPMIESWNLGYKFKIVKPTNANILTETLLVGSVR